MKKLIVVLLLVGGCAARVGHDPMLEGDGGDDSTVSLLPLGPDGKPILPDGGELDVDGGELPLADGAVIDLDGGAGSAGSTDVDAGPQAGSGGGDQDAGGAGMGGSGGAAGTAGSDPDAGPKLNACGGTDTVYCPEPWEGSLGSNPSKHARCSPKYVCAGDLLQGNGNCPFGCTTVTTAATYWRCDSDNTVTCDACDCSKL